MKYVEITNDGNRNLIEIVHQYIRVGNLNELFNFLKDALQLAHSIYLRSGEKFEEHLRDILNLIQSEFSDYQKKLNEKLC